MHPTALPARSAQAINTRPGPLLGRWLQTTLPALSLAPLLALAAAPAQKVDDAFVQSNAKTTPEWPTYGLNYGETRHSELARINQTNVQNLGLVWSYNLGSIRGVEATPLVVDGVMFVTAPWSIVTALDARTGKKLWEFDPKVPREGGYKACCDVVNRGVALYKGKVFVASLDGRLIALDAGSGQKLWEKDTIVDHQRVYTITGAPRVFNGLVVIGNGGNEYGVRGYVSAYDAETGREKWRWYTVPGDPTQAFEDESQARAALTWDRAGKWWEAGGGGSPWDTITFDPELNLLYIGTGNGSAWPRSKRSPGGGDNLYVGSLVALHADTGQYAWHFQETPGENWDYDSISPAMLVDLKIDGRLRKTIIHAPKNGFFYVLDRATGQFISGKNYVNVNWASGLDANGRPIFNPAKWNSDKVYEMIPGPQGGHNWQPMSYSPKTGLVYIPAQNSGYTSVDNPNWRYNAGANGEHGSGMGWNTGKFTGVAPTSIKPSGQLLAWDPVKQKAAWQVPLPGTHNGGTLSTAGDLVFLGTSDGRIVAYNAATGAKLWESPVGSGTVAAPMSFEIDGQQYVSVAVGWGGAVGLSEHYARVQSPGTVYTFALGGKAPLPEFAAYPWSEWTEGVKYNPADVPRGSFLYLSNCAQCHAVPGSDSGGNIPNLGRVGGAVINELEKFVLNGPFTELGMPNFTGKLSLDDVQKIKAYIQHSTEENRPKRSR